MKRQATKHRGANCLSLSGTACYPVRSMDCLLVDSLNHSIWRSTSDWKGKKQHPVHRSHRSACPAVPCGTPANSDCLTKIIIKNNTRMVYRVVGLVVMAIMGFITVHAYPASYSAMVTTHQSSWSHVGFWSSLSMFVEVSYSTSHILPEATAPHPTITHQVATHVILAF